MTATQHNLPLELQLDIAKAQFRCLKTPELRREVRLLEDAIKGQDTSTLVFQHVNSRTKRRRGVKLARLIG